MEKYFVGSFVLEKRCGKSIDQIGCCEYALRVETKRNFGLEPKGMSNLEKVLVFALD